MQPPVPAPKHPVHPMLVVLPVGLWGFSLFCDLLYLAGGEAEIWSRLALYAMVGGFISALTALALPAFGLIRMNITLLVVVLYAANIALRLGEPASPALAIALSAIGVGALAMSSWLGVGMLRERSKP